MTETTPLEIGAALGIARTWKLGTRKDDGKRGGSEKRVSEVGSKKQHGLTCLFVKFHDTHKRRDLATSTLV